MSKVPTLNHWWLGMPILLVSQCTWACVVCGTATEASQQAFITSTIALSFIPLLMIGGIAYYLYWANRHNKQP